MSVGVEVDVGGHMNPEGLKIRVGLTGLMSLRCKTKGHPWSLRNTIFFKES